MTAELRVISLGAGVQSSTVYLLACDGQLGQVDAAIFADTGWEPHAVYDHLDRLEAAGSIPIHRQCTHQLKIRPIRWKLTELLDERGLTKRPGVVESLMGISLDEVQRMKPSDVQWVTSVYPLVDRRMTRTDCKAYLASAGWDAPRSACVGCPYHSDSEWRQMKQDRPEEFEDAVQFEREIQVTDAGLRGKPFLHASRVPLDLVDLATREDRGQLNFDDECAGVCGV